MKQIGIIIVTYQSERHIGPLLRSLVATLDPVQSVVYLLDNASTDGTLATILQEQETLKLPVQLIRSGENVGFTRGNNLAYAALLKDAPCETIVLLNPDTVVHPGWWQPLIAALEDPSVGTAAPLLLLPDGTVNSRGNALHFLGLGFVQGYGEKADAVPANPALFSGSGAAVAFRAERLEAMNVRLGTTGIFWEELFLYGEDTDLGWRMRLAGFANLLVTASRVTHDHQFRFQPGDVPEDRMFQVERNRYLLLLANFKAATLAVLLVWIALSEVALGLGLWKLYPHRFRLWRAVAQEARSPGFRARRRKLQAGRSDVKDRDILRAMTGSIRHGALPFRKVDRWLDAGLRFDHRFLCWLVRW